MHFSSASCNVFVFQMIFLVEKEGKRAPCCISGIFIVSPIHPCFHTNFILYSKTLQSNEMSPFLTLSKSTSKSDLFFGVNVCTKILYIMHKRFYGIHHFFHTSSFLPSRKYMYAHITWEICLTWSERMLLVILFCC